MIDKYPVANGIKATYICMHSYRFIDVNHLPGMTCSSALRKSTQNSPSVYFCCRFSSLSCSHRFSFQPIQYKGHLAILENFCNRTKFKMKTVTTTEKGKNCILEVFYQLALVLLLAWIRHWKTSVNGTRTLRIHHGIPCRFSSFMRFASIVKIETKSGPIRQRSNKTASRSSISLFMPVLLRLKQ